MALTKEQIMKNMDKNEAAGHTEEQKKKGLDIEEKKAKKKAEKEARIKAADEAMQKEIDAEYEANKEVEKQALENNGSSIEERDTSKKIQETGEEPEQKLTNPVDDIIVQDVITGKYGTGAARVQALARAGYDPDEVQAKVNEFLSTEKAPVEEKAEEIVEQTEKPAEEQTDTLHEPIPDNVKDELMSSDEGQAAQDAIDGENPVALQNIVGPDGEPLLNGGYDREGRYKAHTYTPEEAAKMQNKGWAGAATIVSVALSALGALFGIPIVPINFYHVLGTDKFIDALNQNEKDYEQLVNAGTAESQAIEKTNAAKTSAYESNAESVKENPDLYDTDITNKVASASAALEGGNTELDVQESQQDWQAVQNELNRKFEKEMKDKDISGQLAILRQNGVNAQELMKLQDDLDVQRIFKKAQIAEEQGMSEDDLAKWIRADSGVTKLQAYAPAVSSLLGSALGLAGGMGTAAIQGANMAKQASLMNPSQNSYNNAAAQMNNRFLRDSNIPRSGTRARQPNGEPTIPLSASREYGTRYGAK